MAVFSGLLDFSNVPLMLLATFTLFVVWVMKTWFWDIYDPSLPPMPERPHPVLGHILKIGKDPRKTMARWRKQAGDVFRFYSGTNTFIVFNGYDVLKEVFVKHADQFSDRPHSFLENLIDNFDKGVIASSGPNWKEERTVALSILRSFGMGKNSLADKIQEEVDFFLKTLTGHKGKAVDVGVFTNMCVANVISAIIVGKRLELDDPFFTNFMHTLDEQVVLLGKANLVSAYAWLRYLPGDLFSINKLVKNNKETLQHFADGFVEKQSQLASQEDSDLRSFITEYAKEMKRKTKENIPTYMSESNLRRTILNLFSAGSETTSTTLLWYMVFLLNHPHIQKKVYETIEEVVGTERLPTMQDRPKLKYLQAVLLETQRMGSVVPFSLTHNCNETVQIRGYTIPKGTTCIPNLDSVLMDEKIWGDPQNFRPERFLDADGNLVNREELIPFSIGRRVCLGESLAKMELFLFASSLSQRFELLPEQDGCPPPQDYVFGITMGPTPFKLRFRDRRGTY